MASQSAAEVQRQLDETRIAPVFFHPNEVYASQIVKACYKGGMRVFEFTHRGVEAPAVFQHLRAFVDRECPEMALGIGTVFYEKDARAYASWGADFIIQPITCPQVGAFCQATGVPWIPAAATLNEIWQARQAGAKVVKLFPGNVLGPGFVKAIKAPMPDVRVMVTGGVEPTAENIRTWFSAGADYLGMGSQLFAGECCNENDFNRLSERVKEVLSHRP